MMRLPMAAWMATSNMWRSISPRELLDERAAAPIGIACGRR